MHSFWPILCGLLLLAARAQAAPPAAQSALASLPSPSQALSVAERGPTVPTTLEKLSLRQALDLASQRNVTVAVAEAESRRVAAVLTQIRASSLPTLIANGTYTRLDNDRTIEGQVFVPANQLAGNVSLTVPLLAPQRWAQWAHAAQDREAAAADAKATHRQIAVSAAHAYLAVLAAGRVIESNERARDVALAHYTFAYKRLAGGIGSELDAVRSLQTLREDAGRVETARSALVQAQGTLGALLGLDHPVDVSEAPDFRLELASGQSVELSVERRADLMALDQHRQAAKKVVRDSWTDYMPSLFGVFMPMYQNPSSIVQPMFAWQLQLQLSVPIYDGGARYGLRRQRAALADEAALQLEGAILRGRTELKAGLAALSHNERAFTDAGQAAQLARRAVEIAELSYKLGASTNLELLDAQRRARDADTAAIIAEDELRRVRLDLQAAGGYFP